MRYAKPLFLAAALGVTANQAIAGNCAQRDAVVDRLETKYAEQLVARGLQSRTAMMELFASAESGTFTVLITSPQGVSCIVGAGTDLILKDFVAKPAGTAG